MAMKIKKRTVWGSLSGSTLLFHQFKAVENHNKMCHLTVLMKTINLFSMNSTFHATKTTSVSSYWGIGKGGNKTNQT
jgi:hypothetical protein